MMNLSSWWIRLLPLFPALLLSSCGEDWAFIEKTYTIDPVNDTWVPVEYEDTVFLVEDNYGIKQSFVLESDYYYLDKSWGGYFGITTDITYTEYRSRHYTSTFGDKFSFSIRAATWEPYGDVLRVEVNDVVFRYDLGLEIITEVSTPFLHIGSTQTSEGYEFEDTILSTCTFLDTVVLNGTAYSDVLHFKLLDAPEKWKQETVREIFLAKETGLVKYILNSRTYYLRKKE
jgi:hypothetical protein